MTVLNNLRKKVLILKRLIFIISLCSALIGSGGIQLNTIDEINYITDNGSYLTPDGIIVLSAIDTELYISGLLNLDSLVSSHGEKQ